MALIRIVVIALVAYRIWRLIARDYISGPFRKWLAYQSKWVFTFVDCPWCLGFWITGAVVALDYFWLGTTEDWLWTWLAASVLVGLLARLDD